MISDKRGTRIESKLPNLFAKAAVLGAEGTRRVSTDPAFFYQI
jgi:hypothetical protein